MKNKPLLQEILWILSCTIFTIIIGFALFGKTIFSDSIDLNLHDTYFVVASQHFLIWFFIVFSFILYFLKEKRYSFNRKLPFLIFSILGLSFTALIIRATPLLAFLNFPSRRGWKIYPPLSLQTKSAPDILPDEGFFSTFLTPINFLILFQIIVIALMLFAAYKYGKYKGN
ncbi:heme/copper-type cytochrome/quinol oxidase subunit 1 [Pedobacter sp. SG908]|nr:heme/copper-type cytochrome/quinol oxidase subunit 1 [Pedobacter sp. SG908]NMN37976.1 heme/copper-type cytochrome/quinol oxidase subunit 1 [Pedobacter sp. SG918]